MANERVVLEFSLQDVNNSIKGANKDAQTLRGTLESIQKISTKTGSKAMAASFSAAGESAEYGRARGSMGSTGAAGRDFANQAQGLGGLVRLYATYAANVFAVSAAFRALSDAMDTSNMVQGLDQLGAASGVAMGSLAKRFAEASGGAISMRDAMEATAKSMSSGMSQKQFLVLGDVAKKASQALGVNMADAVSRLTRGITKLEPELLDELGLFTKVGKSSEDYARSVGKSVDNLTDFEKRQAFANAVLKEGIDKFNEIDIPTNPYDKLLASLKNIAQTILEVLNKAFVPLVDVLSASPAALTAGIAALGSMIVKQAIPAIGNYRDQLRQTADLAQKVTTEKIDTAETMLAKRRADILAKQDIAAQQKADIIDNLERKLRTLTGGRIREDIAKILTPTRGIQDITETEIQKIEKAGRALKSKTNVYTELATAIRSAQVAQQNYLATEAKLAAEAASPVPKTSALGRLQAGAEEQRRRSTASTIISNAADTASLVGFRAAFGEMIDSLKTEKLGVLRTIFTGITGTITAATTRLMGFVGIIGNIGMIVGVAVGIFQGLSAMLSDNAKQVEKFSRAVELGEDNTKALTNTYNKYKESLSPASVIALSTSFQNLSENVLLTADSFRDAVKESSKFDKIINAIKGIFGQGLEDDFAKSLSTQVSEGLRGIVDPAVKKDAESKLKELLNINEVTQNNIKASVAGLGQNQLIKVGKDIAAVFQTASNAGQKTAGILISIKDGFKALETSYTELSNSLMQKDPLSSFGKDLISQGLKLSDAFKDPIANLATLQDLLTDISKIKLLSPESQKLIMENRDAYVALINTAKYYEDQIAKSETNIANIRKEVGKDRTGVVAKDIIEAEKKTIESAKLKLDDTRQQMTDFSRVFKEASENSIRKGFELIQGSFTRAMADSVISAQKSLLDKLPQTAETAKLGAKLENQKIDLQIQQITETQRLIKEMELLRLSGEKIALERSRDEILKTATGSVADAARNNPRLKEIEAREKILTSTNISKDINAGKIERTEESRKAMQEQQGAMAKVTQLQQQKLMNVVGAEITGIQLTYDKTKKTVEEILKGVTATKEQEMKSDAFRQSSLADQQATVDAYIQQEDSLKRSLNTLDSYKELAVSVVVEKAAERNKWWDIYDISLKTQETTQKQLQTADSLFVTTNNTATAERKRAEALAVSSIELTKLTTTLEGQANLTRARNEIESSLTSIQRESLQTQLDLGILTSENYRAQSIALEQADRLKQRDIKLDQLKNELIITQIGLTKELNAATNADDIANIQAKMSNASRVYEVQADGVKRVFNEQEKAKRLTEDLSDRQLAYGDVFKKSFEGMADAIIEFTKTGKLNFSGMIDSMIEGLIRYEMQQQALMMYSAFRPGLMNLVGSIFGPATGSLDAGPGAYPVGRAKGGVYDAGVEMFAKGGMFTNSIVESPTLFKFAKGGSIPGNGTGVMGEAGPEAIMPLKRDNNGNLGVRANNNQAKVDVVVNNYGSEKAETRETVDSRGNRKIEVIVGEMTAGEITRSGSASQKAIRGTFGLQPQLIRR